MHDNYCLVEGFHFFNLIYILAPNPVGQSVGLSLISTWPKDSMYFYNHFFLQGTDTHSSPMGFPVKSHPSIHLSVLFVLTSFTLHLQVPCTALGAETTLGQCDVLMNIHTVWSGKTRRNVKLWNYGCSPTYKVKNDHENVIPDLCWIWGLFL